MVRKLLVSGFLFVMLAGAAPIAAPAPAPDPNWGTPWDAMLGKPGTKVVYGKDASGNETRELRLASGVTVTQIRHGKQVQNVENDVSGHGAVMCAWGIYLQLREQLESCNASGNEPLKKNLDTAISRIGDFIVANAVPPMSKADVDGMLQQRLGVVRKEAAGLPQAQKDRQCKAGETTGTLQKLRTMPQAQWDSSLNDLLAVPRPPVMNPCL